MGPSRAVLGASWAVLEPSWAVLGPWPSWGSLGGLLGRLGASETRKGENPNNIENHNENQWFLPLGALLGASWGNVFALLGPPGSLLGRKARIVGWCSSSRARRGAVLAHSWAVLGGSWAFLEPSWLVLGPSWEHLGPSLGSRGGLLGRLGASEARKAEKANNLQKSNENQ